MVYEDKEYLVGNLTVESIYEEIIMPNWIKREKAYTS